MPREFSIPYETPVDVAASERLSIHLVTDFATRPQAPDRNE